MDLKETDIIGDAVDSHWYYHSKAQAVAQLIAKIAVSKILDVGAGSGFFSRQLLKIQSIQEACCVDTGYESDADAIENNKPIYFRRAIASSDADLVLFMDVLEHVDNDIDFLKEYVQKVGRGTHFLISVPAFQFLWSSHDDFLEHKRRYNWAEIENTIRASGLSILHGSYYFGLIFPLAAAIRGFEKIPFLKGKENKSHLKPHHPITNYILKKICGAELSFLNYNRLAGLTAFCLAVKK